MRRTGLDALLFTLPFALAACGQVEPTTAENADQALSSSYGGETTADEAPAFGDPVIAGAEFQTEDAVVADSTTDRPDLTGARHVRIAVAWGYLRPRPEATQVVDWSGSITVANAGLRVLRTLRFEDQDVVIRPRTDIHTVEFDSHTRPAADGLLLDVVIAPVLNPTAGPITLTFATAPFTDTLTLQPGMRLHAVKPVDAAGHVVAYDIIRPDADGCTEGFVRGRWRAAGEVAGRAVGVLTGRFIAGNGQIRGHLRGVFGVRENGKQVWFAKVIDKDGNFIGVLAGRYGDGKFAGLLLGKDATGSKIVLGQVRGHYFAAPDAATTAATDAGAAAATAAAAQGRFIGRYSEKCGEDAREGTPSNTDEPELSLDAQ